MTADDAPPSSAPAAELRVNIASMTVPVRPPTVAPIPAEMLAWFRTIGVPLSEVYGLSETTGAMTWDPWRVVAGSVGRGIRAEHSARVAGETPKVKAPEPDPDRRDLRRPAPDRPTRGRLTPSRPAASTVPMPLATLQALIANAPSGEPALAALFERAAELFAADTRAESCEIWVWRARRPAERELERIALVGTALDAEHYGEFTSRLEEHFVDSPAATPVRISMPWSMVAIG